MDSGKNNESSGSNSKGRSNPARTGPISGANFYGNPKHSRSKRNVVEVVTESCIQSTTVEETEVTGKVKVPSASQNAKGRKSKRAISSKNVEVDAEKTAEIDKGILAEPEPRTSNRIRRDGKAQVVLKKLEERAETVVVHEGKGSQTVDSCQKLHLKVRKDVFCLNEESATVTDDVQSSDQDGIRRHKRRKLRKQETSQRFQEESDAAAADADVSDLEVSQNQTAPPNRNVDPKVDIEEVVLISSEDETKIIPRSVIAKTPGTARGRIPLPGRIRRDVQKCMELSNVQMVQLAAILDGTSIPECNRKRKYVRERGTQTFTEVDLSELVAEIGERSNRSENAIGEVNSVGNTATMPDANSNDSVNVEEAIAPELPTDESEERTSSEEDTDDEPDQPYSRCIIM